MSGNGPKESGAGEWTRTIDLLITNQLLYQLSYTGLGRNPNRSIGLRPHPSVRPLAGGEYQTPIAGNIQWPSWETSHSSSAQLNKPLESLVIANVRARHRVCLVERRALVRTNEETT